MTEFRKVVGYMAVFIAGFAACAGVLRLTGKPTDPRSGTRGGLLRPVSGAKNPAPLAGPGGGLPSVADAAARVEPAVVNIEITGVRKGRSGPFAFLRPGRSEPFEGSGSGILLSADGYVVTNNHVVAPIAERGEGAISVKLDSGREFTNVSVVGRDPATDLAVLKIHGARHLPTAELGDSESLRVGDWAIAVGNPLGFNSTVTLGIISALNRSYSRSDTSALDRVIQTDAAINPGNSGGALADIEGNIIGINTAIASQNGGSVGIGFAIPINAARRVIEQLIQKGKVVRPYLGVAYVRVDNVEKEALPDEVTLPEDGRGAMVFRQRGEGAAVLRNSPADRAGLREYDVIRAIDGRMVEDARTVRATVLEHEVGDRLTLRIWRNGQEFDTLVTLDTMPDDYFRRNQRRGFSPEEFLDPERGGEVTP
ncbi:MAG: trypsin-like peptidase domain-containing protein [Capsulimonadales bacterium]|nr:trypsin-like peptidase domain-containing protein [Capsulimonadales bacterium]